MSLSFPHRISTIGLYRLQVPLKEPFVISLGPISRVHNVVVHIQTASGIEGWGECSPYPTINGETADTCVVVGRLLAAALAGADATDLAGNTAKMDRLIWANSSIKSAFDMALYDVAAQAAGLPLYRFLGGVDARPLYTGMTVSLAAPQKMAADARRYQKEGFGVIKVKLGGSKTEDEERIAAIRQAIGRRTPLRIDANQGWPDAMAALEVLEALAPYGIQHCEEPIPRWLYHQLPALSKASPIPIMADESLCDQHDAARLIALNACPLFNVKLGKTAGFFKATQVLAAAAQAGMGVQIGGFMESRLGMTAAAHLALSSLAVHYCDFDTPLMFEADPVQGGIIYGEGGSIQLPAATGLGAVIETGFLTKIKT